MVAVKAKIRKYLSALPATLTNSTLYLVKRLSGFDLYATNDLGVPVAYRVNGTPAGNDRSVQFNDNGDMAGATALTVDANGNLVVTESLDTATPGPGKVALFARDWAMRSQIVYKDELGIQRSLQDSLLFNGFFLFNASESGNNGTVINGTVAQSGQVGLVAGFAGNANDHAISKTRVSYRTSVLNTSLAYGFSQAFCYMIGAVYNPVTPSLGDSVGGFGIFRFHREDPGTIVTAARIFVGFSQSVTTPTNVAPSTLSNAIGIVKDGNDVNYSLYSSGSGVGVKIPLGSDFPANVNYAVIELIIYQPVNKGTIYYMVRRVNDSSVATVSGQFDNANLPQILNPTGVRWWIGSQGSIHQAGLSVQYCAATYAR